jgi:hypothetical protein
MASEGVPVALVVVAAVWAGSALGAPAVPAPAPAAAGTAPVPADRYQGLLEQLAQVGERLRQANDPPAVAATSLQQAEIITQILGVVKPEERDSWLGHLAGCLAIAAMDGPAQDQTAYRRLAGLAQDVARTAPGSALAAHVAFLELQAACALRLSAPGADAGQAQEYRRQRLAQFVKMYPRGEDTPTALAELGGPGAGSEAEVRACYRQLAESFPDDPRAAQARRALHRLELPGREMDLALPFLNNPSETFQPGRLAGQVVVVYCWSGGDEESRRNGEALEHINEQYGSKGLALVLVNLDPTLAQGQDASAALSLPAVQLFAAGGPDGAWAENHGVTDLPAVFVVGRDGRVVTQVTDKDGLARELRKQFHEEAPAPRR